MDVLSFEVGARVCAKTKTAQKKGGNKTGEQARPPRTGEIFNQKRQRNRTFCTETSSRASAFPAGPRNQLRRYKEEGEKNERARVREQDTPKEKTHEEGARAVQRRQGREAVGVGLAHEVLEEGVQVREGCVHGHLTRVTTHINSQEQEERKREEGGTK